MLNGVMDYETCQTLGIPCWMSNLEFRAWTDPTVILDKADFGEDQDPMDRLEAVVKAFNIIAESSNVHSPLPLKTFAKSCSQHIQTSSNLLLFIRTFGGAEQNNVSSNAESPEKEDMATSADTEYRKENETEEVDEDVQTNMNDDTLGLSPENPYTPPHQITSAEDYLPKTPSRSHSINKVLKRKEHDFYETPERVKHHLAIQKIEQKIHSIENGEAIPRALANQDQPLPKALYRILDSPLIRYYCPNIHFDGQSFISHAKEDETQVVSMAIESHAQKLVNAVMVGSTYWILLTHFDVFLQNMSGIDDCAIPCKWPYSVIPIVKMISKTEFGKEWKEIIVQWGRMQVLAVGGFFGQVGSYHKTAFLGSAISADAAIADDNFRILVPFCQQPFLRTTRYLRNFCKYGASLEWSFCSEQFFLTTFHHVTPRSMIIIIRELDVRRTLLASSPSYCGV